MSRKERMVAALLLAVAVAGGASIPRLLASPAAPPASRSGRARPQRRSCARDPDSRRNARPADVSSPLLQAAPVAPVGASRAKRCARAGLRSRGSTGDDATTRRRLRRLRPRPDLAAASATVSPPPPPPPTPTVLATDKLPPGAKAAGHASRPPETKTPPGKTGHHQAAKTPQERRRRHRQGNTTRGQDAARPAQDAARQGESLRPGASGPRHDLPGSGHGRKFRKLRPTPWALTIAAWDIWRRLPPAQRRQLLKLARKHGPKLAARAAKAATGAPPPVAHAPARPRTATASSRATTATATASG